MFEISTLSNFLWVSKISKFRFWVTRVENFVEVVRQRPGVGLVSKLPVIESNNYVPSQRQPEFYQPLPRK